jgi:hypothetical protein
MMDKYGAFGGMRIRGKPKYLEETCLSAILSTTNPTSFDLGSNLGHHGGKLVNSCLSYAVARYCYINQLSLLAHMILFYLKQ